MPQSRRAVGTNTARSSAPQLPRKRNPGYAPYEAARAAKPRRQNGYAAPNANTQQGYYTRPGPSPTKPYQNAYQAPYGLRIPRRIRWRDLPHVRFRSHIATNQFHPVPCFDHHLRPFDHPSRMDASMTIISWGNLQGQEAQHHRVWRCVRSCS